MKHVTLALIAVLTLGVSLEAKEMSLENKYLKRTITTDGGILKTKSIENKLAKTVAEPAACDEFHLRISEGTHTTGTDVDLTSADFKVKGSKACSDEIVVELESAKHDLKINVHYTLDTKESWIRKHLEIVPKKDTCLERIDVEAVTLDDAYQPYTVSAINATGKWSPGLGQPLYTTNSATFWGVEFPAAYNHVKEQKLNCGYLWGRSIMAGEVYVTYKSVVGAGDDAEYIQDAFLAYINEVRVRPLRLQIQYNSWFDYRGGVSREKFLASARKIHEELVEERKNKPLKAYVIDDGWQDRRSSWEHKVWPVNHKFDKDFQAVRNVMADSGSELGLWLSPGCLFGARGAIPGMRELGWEAMDNWMSMAGPQYMGKLEERLIELTGLGASYFKLDGVFGHLGLRNFELHGKRYGMPYMPQLGLDGIKAGAKELNDAKYDELKLYYLTAGTERLMKIFGRMAEVNPEVYIVISNGAYLSPWWLQYVDSIWMINAGDAAGGASRTGELVYRDAKYYEIFVREKTQYPMCALFNHEPKKVKRGESKDAFRRYLYMNISRGTGLIELYLKTFNLQEWDWDVLSEGLHWSYEVFPTFHRSRMHGGDPRRGEVYGYTAWTEKQGYISIHNPSDETRPYSMTLDRKFGLMPDSGSFKASSPIADCTDGLKEVYAYGDTIDISLKPQEIRILNFDKSSRDWSKLRALQTRTKQVAVKVEPIENHAVLGVWQYGGHSREFTKAGKCILRKGDEVIWTKPFAAKDKNVVMVEWQYEHVLMKDGTLKIEDRYTAKRK